MKRDASAIVVVDSDEESAVVVVDDDAPVIVAVVPVVSGSGWESRVAAYGLDPVSFRWLCNLGAPVGFFNVLHWLRASFGSREDLRCIDGFAGAARIFSAFSAAGLPSAAYDLDNDPVLQNILSAPGFITLVQWCRRLKAFESFSSWGVLCSSWIFMSRSSTGRRPYNVEGERVDGSTTRSVREGNLMASRMSLILMLLMVRGTIFCVEQPESSLLFNHHRFAHLRRKMRLFRCNTWLGAYGGDSAKLIKVLSNHQCVYTLHRKLNMKTFEAKASAVVVKLPDGRVSGGPDLKASQTYPVAYASTLLDMYLAADPAELREGFIVSPRLTEPQIHDLWTDAGLQEVCEYLGVPHDRLLV